MSESLAPSFPDLSELGGWLPLYEVERQVHAGRDSALYLGHQTALDRMVVIEVIPEPGAAEITSLMDRLRARARLVHPGISAVYDFGRTPTGFLYLVTEHVEGRSLGSLIVERQIKPKNAFPLAIEICEALQLIHDHELAHGALSPATVLVNQEGRAKLTCMGMAVTEEGELSWLEPFQGGAHADMRDLGITLHWMFARCELDADGRLSRDLPPSFAAVLRRCLGQDPARELHHPAEVAEALHEALRLEQARGEPGGKAKMIVAAGVKASPSQVESSAPTPPTSPPLKPGKMDPIVRQHRPSFYQRLDAFVWRAFSTGLHLLISLVSIGSLVLLVLFKDRIVIEQPAAEDEVAAVETIQVEPPMESPVMEMPAKAPPMITEPPPPVKPISGGEIQPAPTPPAPPKDPLADLRAQYVTAVQQAANQALETVRLDDLPYLQKELQLLQNNGEIPDVDEPGLPATLRALRQRYREARIGITR
ncbi:Protein kinase domain-containing protein [Prosthecobacter debontii]|uniref:Protein kinase domain-containing protein n=1 Tax=Prosthecobacter debontii TaxID=48467 RepID=A0A1T4X9L9_9BACT|nr:protein kinase [Prosthecobacter debontii]SKA86276.1 Protein kinase domain-containing protein [Prosthecobacter debontii]